MSTNIEWTDETWNPVTGCSKVSPGCAHCYAEGVALRFWRTQYPPVEVDTCEGTTVRQRAFTDVWCHPDRLREPLAWRKPRRVFVNSMSDLFHEDVPDEFIRRVFDTMALASRHTFQVLTKRAERMQWLVPALARRHTAPDGSGWPLRNVWLGVSAENQRFLDERVPLLLETPAAVRFVSAEPLLEGLDIAKHRPGANRLWFIVGGESGPNARPCAVQWIRSIVRQCQEADAPVFVKQLGSNPIQRVLYGPATFEADQPGGSETYPASGKGGDPSEWPSDLRVREFPVTREGSTQP